jgi:hypothetical protein
MAFRSYHHFKKRSFTPLRLAVLKQIKRYKRELKKKIKKHKKTK